MKEIEVEIEKHREEGLIGKAAEARHVAHRVEPGTIVREKGTGKTLIVFGKFESEHSEVKKSLPSIKYNLSSRLTQLNNDYENEKNMDTTFGFVAKRPVFGHPASACKFNYTYAEHYKKFTELGVEMMGLYEKFNPETFQEQSNKTKVIKDLWKIPGTFFTQGIINDTVKHSYHYDRGNIKGCWSCMAVFTRQISGGSLIVPALNISLSIEDETYAFFDGQSFLHGVEPIKSLGEFSRRFSIVYYAIEAMKNCDGYDDEIEKMRRVDMNKHNKSRKS